MAGLAGLCGPQSASPIRCCVKSRGPAIGLVDGGDGLSQLAFGPWRMWCTGAMPVSWKPWAWYGGIDTMGDIGECGRCGRRGGDICEGFGCA